MSKKTQRHLHFVLNMKTYKKLCSDAKLCGLSRSAYLRRLINGEKVKARPAAELQQLYTEVNHIGNNINQIARSVNAGIATPQTASESLLLLGKVYDLMEKMSGE